MDQSPLYCLNNRRKLAELLEADLPRLEHLAKGGLSEYKLFSTRDSNLKVREIEWPKPELFKVVSNLNRLISRIETPSYLHSGIKGRSYVTNATSHRTDQRLAKIDIRSFYKSASSYFVYKCFHNTFRCSPDVASVLYKITTIKGHLPTGSPTSVVLSFYAYKDMFDEIYCLALANGIVMSLCVDDRTFSAAEAGSNFLYAVRGIVKKFGLKVHKRHCFTPSQNKIVTGVTLARNGVRLPNKRRKSVFESVEAFNSAENAEQKLKLSVVTLGRLAEASQVEPKTFTPVFRYVKNQAAKLRNLS